MGRTVLIGLVTLFATTVAESMTLQDRLRARFGSQVAAIQGTGGLWDHQSSQAQFYALRDYRAAWVGEMGPTPLAVSVLEHLSRVGEEGLNPSRYSSKTLLRRSSRLDGLQWSAERRYGFELALTQSVLRYAEDVVDGRVDPARLYGDWESIRHKGQAARRVAKALEAADPLLALASLQPEHPGFVWLKAALAHYRTLDALGIWPRLALGANLEPGMVDRRVGTVRRQLGLTGDLSAVAAADQSLRYDGVLAAAVRRFQRRHGLEDDAIVGAATRAALNVTPAERARQIELNLERWRWLPPTLGDRYIVVNVADYRLMLVEQGHVVLESPVIVGQDYRQTPVFSAELSYLVVNPWWEVPERIAVEDKLPLIQQDPDYLAAQGFVVLQGWGRRARVIQPESVNWRELGPRHFPYRLRQRPGPRNALGRIKFMFPNRFSVYLHDTPQRALFRETQRNFSSGCIRVARPWELAAALLRREPSWETGARLQQLLDKGREHKVPLSNSVPTHMLYWTAWADADGVIQFREDIYGRDAILSQALERIESWHG